MAVVLQVEHVGAVLAPDQYQVSWSVVTATEIPTQVFVYDFATDKFSRVATPQDMSLPTTRTPTSGFYRRSTAQAVYTNIATANSQISIIDGDLEDLATAYQNNLADFTTPVTTTYP